MRSTSFDVMAFYADVEDPADVAPVRQAYCVVTEIHLNVLQQAWVGVVQCWRSRQAFLADRDAFRTIPISMKPDEGGKDFFKSQGIDGAQCQLGPLIAAWCCKHNPMVFAAPKSAQEEVVDA